MVLGRSDDKDTMIYTNTRDPSHQTKYDNSTYTSDGTLRKTTSITKRIHSCLMCPA